MRLSQINLATPILRSNFSYVSNVSDFDLTGLVLLERMKIEPDFWSKNRLHFHSFSDFTIVEKYLFFEIIIFIFQHYTKLYVTTIFRLKN